MKNNIFINGRFLTQKITGVQRYALEIVKAIDDILSNYENFKDYDFIILVPKDCKDTINFRNIDIREVGYFRGHIWEQLELPFYSKNGFLINLCNCAPIIKKQQSVTIHDAATEVMKESFSKLFRFWYKIMYYMLSKRIDIFFTVSEFSKKQINEIFGINANKIHITYNGIEHIINIIPDDRIIQKNCLKKYKYILGVSSLNPSKNFKYLIEAAGRLKEYDFVIVGGTNNMIFNSEALTTLPNVKFVGYVSDQELMALYKNAYCFVYPSLYEGFGIPPMEAMSFMCPAIVSELEVFKEIYRDKVIYCNPYNIDSLVVKIVDKKYIEKNRALISNVNLKNLYSWKHAAHKILNIICKKIGN